MMGYSVREIRFPGMIGAEKKIGVPYYITPLIHYFLTTLHTYSTYYTPPTLQIIYYVGGV
jgi:hypothetical protein